MLHRLEINKKIYLRNLKCIFFKCEKKISLRIFTLHNYIIYN